MLRKRNRRREGWEKIKRESARERERETTNVHRKGNGRRQREEGHIRHAEGGGWKLKDRRWVSGHTRISRKSRTRMTRRREGIKQEVSSVNLLTCIAE